jgi:predicted transposase/invertase (TIGR01784 family)
MNEKERIAYNKYQSNLHYEASMIFSSYGVGKVEGIKEGIEKGIKKGIIQEKIEVAKKLLQANMDIQFISDTTGLDIREIEDLRRV